MRPLLISVHYHLRPGGVTTVIHANDRILRQADRSHLILSRETPGLENLDYRQNAPGDLVDPLLASVTHAHPGRTRVWHFHNPCLGKNPALTRSLTRLAARGEPMILQHHDLAEDGRPGNLAQLNFVAQPYPRAARILHAFLNRRDRDAFLSAGLPRDQALILPNPRPASPPLPPVPDGPARVLSPMRGLPRKNLGEMLLLAAAAPAGTRFFQGSAPRQPQWQGSYEHWQQVAANAGLDVDFNVFGSAPPREWMGRATHVLTTSTHEGFGMIHLEAAGQRRVIGRRIPYLDLEGFPTQGLYDALRVGSSDFAQLDTRSQERVIAGVRSGTTAVNVEQGTATHPLPQWLAGQLAQRQPPDASHALGNHSDAAHLARLERACSRLLAAPQESLKILDRHLLAKAFQ